MNSKVGMLNDGEMKAFNKGICSDCTGFLVEGSCAGYCINYICLACYNIYNDMYVADVERVGKAKKI